MKTQQPLTFEEYLAYDDGTKHRYELLDGELVALPPESESNDFIANYLFLVFANAKLVPPRLIRTHTCEIQVPVLRQGDAMNRFPDLVVLREEHLALMQKRLTILLDMPPPVLVAEVISPGKDNRNRDLNRKQDQYGQRGIPEYWLIDPEYQTITVLWLEFDHYREIGQFKGSDLISSPTFPALQLTSEQVFRAEG
jgi:Uma2 family endonuclease